MALVVRVDVELFRLVKRKKDPNSEILSLIDLSRSLDVQLQEESLGYGYQHTLPDSTQLSMIYTLQSTLRCHSIGSYISISSLIPL